MNGTTRKLLTSVHIAVAVSVLGIDVALVALGLAGYSADPAAVYPAAALIGSRVLWPLAVAALGTGVTLAFVGPYGLLRFWWVITKLAITVALTALLAFVLLPALAAAAEATSAGEPLTQSRRLMLTVGPLASSSLLLTNVALAVFKPRWRLPRPARRARSEAPA